MPQHANEQIKLTVGANIKLARETKGLTQRQLAVALNKDGMTVSRWERGKVLPELANLVEVADKLEQDVSWFYTEQAA